MKREVWQVRGSGPLRIDVQRWRRWVPLSKGYSR